MSDDTPDKAPDGIINTGADKFALKPDWTIGEVFSEAWQLKDGFKGTYWGAVLVYAVITGVVSGVSELIGDDASLVLFVWQLITSLLTLPLFAGMLMIAIKRSVDIPTSTSMVFDYYPKTIPIFLLYLLMMAMITLGFILLVLPGVYLAFAYMLAIPLLVDKNMKLWEALETSRKAITPCWFRTFALCIVSSIIIAVSAIPLGIGLIWTIPFVGLVMAIVYRNLLGVSQSA
jgi:hypothetical protein